MELSTKLMELYYKDHDILQHQKDSYNDYIDNIIPNILNQFFPININILDDKIIKKISIQINNINISDSICMENNGSSRIMTPKLANNSIAEAYENKSSKLDNINEKIKEYQKFIKKNFDYVGKNFAYEARSIHYNNKKREKGIYGTASDNEIKELKEEGINTETIPWIENKKN